MAAIASFRQFDRSLEEAARSLGASWTTTMRRVAFPPLRLAEGLRSEGIELAILEVDRGTLHAEARKIRVSFLEYRYPLLRSPLEWGDRGCAVASLEDLACMKLSAIGRRGEKNDFVDLYAVSERGFSLGELLEMYREKFSVRDVGHVLRSLTYFDEAEETPMRAMLLDLDWGCAKEALRRRVEGFVRGGGSGKT